MVASRHGCRAADDPVRHPPPAFDRRRDGGGRVRRVLAALPDAGRSRGGHCGRHCDGRGHPAHPREPRPRRAVPVALRALGVGPAARRPRHVDLHQSSGRAPDRAARRANAVVDVVHARGLDRRRRAARRRRGSQGRSMDRPRRHGVFGAGLLGAGVRDRVRADPDAVGPIRSSARPGISKPERRRLGVAASSDPAEHRARDRLRGADRAHDARQHAGRARAGLYPDGRRRRASHPTRC